MSETEKTKYDIYKKCFRIEDDVLKKVTTLKSKEGQETFHTICIPGVMKKDILRHHHGSPLSGHLGIAKLTPTMKRRYHWPKMTTEIRKWVKGCATCQRRKQYRRNNYGIFQGRTSYFPWERACMDLVGPLPESDNHNRYLLTIIDTFSRWPIAIPIPNKETSTIAEAIYKNLISIHGCPVELFSDQENNLMGTAISELCSRLNIKRITSSCYAPWQNGHVERFHRYLGASLSMYAADHKRDWDKWVDCVLFTYRVSVHMQTGESPYRILYNRDPILGADLLLNTYPKTTQNEGKPTDEITKNLFKWFSELAKKQKAITKLALRKRNEKDKRVEPEFKDGDWILLYDRATCHSHYKQAPVESTQKVPRRTHWTTQNQK